MGTAILFFSIVAFVGVLLALWGWAMNEEARR